MGEDFHFYEKRRKVKIAISLCLVAALTEVAATPAAREAAKLLSQEIHSASQHQAQ